MHTYEIVDINIELLSVMEVRINTRLVQDYLSCALIQQLVVLRSVEESIACETVLLSLSFSLFPLSHLAQ